MKVLEEMLVATFLVVILLATLIGVVKYSNLFKIGLNKHLIEQVQE